MLTSEFGFEDESAFFEQASTDAATYEIYRRWITWFAGDEIDRLIVEKSLGNGRRGQLMAAAMEPFDKAFELYKRRDATSSVDYPFSKYYRWWARQYAMLEVLNR